MPSWIHSLWNILFPERDTEKIVARLSISDIEELPRPTDQLPDIISLFSYKDPNVQALIWELKYHRNSYALKISAQVLATRITKELQKRNLPVEQCLITGIPLTKKRMRERTYSQTDLLCREILAHIPLTYNPICIQKVRDTTRQNKTVSKHERLENLHDVFRATDVVRGKHIIVIDDVATTGATLYEIQKTLIHTGAASVISFTLAH